MQHTPRVYLSQPSPPPPQSPMDFSYEFLMFQCGNHDTKERLEFYQTFIMRLLGEVKTLRETVSASCQQKCASSTTTGSGIQLLAAPDDSIPPMKRRRVEDSLPRMPETDIILCTPAPAPGSSSPPINEEIDSDSSSLFERMTERNKSNDRMFYAERDALADTTTNVTFVHSFHHENSVLCVCFSRDGRYLAVGTANNVKGGSIVIYEVESRKKYCELKEYPSQYGSYTRPVPWYLCFSSDGRYLSVLDNAKRNSIWDVPKKRIRSIFYGGHHMYNVCFSPDGRLVAFRTRRDVVVLNMRDNSRRMVSKGSSFDFSPDGRLIATWNFYFLLILNVRTGKAVERWNGRGRYLRSVKFTLDGRGLLCAYTDMIEQWDVSDAEPVLIRELDIPNNSFYPTSISLDHRLLALSDVLIDIHTGKLQYTFKGHTGIISSVDFSAAGTYLAIGAYEGIVSLWKYTCS